jgi:hypothetical protein
MRKCHLHFTLILLFSLFTIGKINAQTCPTGLISNWKMDEVGGITLHDFVGGHDATCNVELGTDPSGKVGLAQTFAFTNRASVINNAAYNFGVNSSFSIVYWMKFTEIEYGTQDHVILSKGDYGGGVPLGAFWSTGVNGSGKVNFLLNDNSTGNFGQIESADGYNDGVWHQVVCVRDGAANKNILYVDGSPVAQENRTYTSNFTNTYSIAFSYLLSNAAMGYYYKGSVDEVGIFNRALSPSDISVLISNANIGVGYCDGFYPNISSLPKTTASVGTLYTYTVHAGGSQTNMQYSLITKPSGMTINSSSGLISWTPTSIDADGFVQVRANNNIAPADTQSFRIFISEAPVCPNNLIFLLKLDENSGPVYADHYGLHNAVAAGSVSATPGKINGAQFFDANSKLNIPDNGTEFDWENGASFSIECWIKTNTTSGMAAIARNRIDYNEAGASWWIGTNAAGKAAFELRDNSAVVTSTISGVKLLSDGNWHHILAVRNGTSKLNILYVDGIEEASASVNYTNSFVADDPTEVNVGYIHRSSSDKAEYHFLGSIDEVAVYNRAVTSTEASSFYNNGNPVGHCALGNFAPAITSTPVTSAFEDVLYTYNVKAEDPNSGDVLILSAVTKPSWLNFNWTAGQKTATLTGTPGPGNTGPNNVTIRVYDGHVQKDQSFVIDVVNTNNTPVVTSTPVTSVNEDVAYTYTLTVTDADAADNINMTIVSKPSWLNFTYSTGAKTATLAGTPGNSDAGSSTVDISITDGHITIHHTYTLTVIAVNDAPVISAQTALSTNEDQSITLQKANFTITDVDNPLTDVTLKVQAGTNYTYIGNTVTPSANFNGSLTVNVVAHDLNNDSQTFQTLITVVAVNDAPVVTSTPIVDAYVGNLYAYIFTATDVDDATLTRSVVLKPDWLLFSVSTGVLTGTPVLADKGQHLVILRVSDGNTDTDQDFIVTVDGPNGLQDLEAAGIRVYPVPAKEYLDVQFEKLTEETQAEIVSSTGSIIMKATIPSNTNRYRLDLKGMESGTYYLRVSNNTINNIGRFVILK